MALLMKIQLDAVNAEAEIYDDYIDENPEKIKEILDKCAEHYFSASKNT